MMRIERAPTPRGFLANVYRPGCKWLSENPHPKSPKPLWNTERLENGVVVREELAERYHHICAYSLFRLMASFVVEHFRPKQHFVYRKLSYCWLNYRLADFRLNCWKGTSDLPDPFKIGKNACVLNFSKEAIIEVDRAQEGWENLEKAIVTLRLNVGAYKTNRYEAYVRYLAEDEQSRIGVKSLTQNYPFVAYEMLRQGYIKECDREACINCLRDLGFHWVP